MAKKKKTQLRPVARGFATTSVPKKVIPPQLTLDEQLPQTEDDADNEDTLLAADGIRDGDTIVHELSNDGFDPEKVEEQSLQILIDRFQEKTEKEITRTVKAVEVDRRYSKTLPCLDIDPHLRDQIISLVEDLKKWDGQKPLEEPEEKAIARLGITYGVLRRLGFSEERVEECLRCIDGIDLEEAYEWLYIHCSENELQEKSTPEAQDSTTPRTSVSRNLKTSQTPRLPSQFLLPKPTLQKGKGLDVNAPAFIPKTPSTPKIFADDEEETIKSRILETYNGASDSDVERSELDDLTLEYVRLRLRIENLTSSQRSTSINDELSMLHARLGAITENYLFDEKEAKAHYRSEREKADSSALQKKLESSLPLIHESPKKPSQILQPVPSAPQVAATDVFADDDSGDSVGGVLDFLDDVSSTEINVLGTTFSLRNMAPPKHWSGRTPKTLLHDTVAKADRYAAISYNIISGHSRAKRASVAILWEGKKRDEWSMEDVACPDDGQAEQYISIVALHALSFPLTDGFAAGTPITSHSHTFFRLLPAVYRGLWEDLEAARKIRDDSINRSTWAKLRTIIEGKLEGSVKVNNKLSKLTFEKQDVDLSPPLPNNQEIFSEKIASGFRTRQASGAYQEMLTQRNMLPIAQHRAEILKILANSQVLVLSGETGCGKSTQVPSFILEDHLSRGKPCKIYCTEPRRISAISLAQRVSRELGDPPNVVGTANSLVGYSIRLESNISRNTRLAFVTNGIALRMLEGGSGSGGKGTAFDEITHIIVDEVHERTIESDFLLIVLKSLLERKPDLKVILMSATVDAEKISTFFGGCPTMHVPGRTFPVDIRYLEDAVEYTKWSVAEGSSYARRLYDKFYQGRARPDWAEETINGGDDDDDEGDCQSKNMKLEKRYSPETASTLNLFDERLIPYDLILCLLEKICFEDASYSSYSSAILIFMPGLGEIRRLHNMLAEHPAFGSNTFRLYPLHSTLSNENQGAVFDVPPAGVRKIVIATNIAETGITIPDITCVIDSGKHREMRFDEKRQISRLVETFIARSNAAQRRGRAGRVQRGLCFHLFTKIRHDTQMADSPLPEMMRLSLSDLALRIKIIKVNLGTSIEDVLSRAMDPPVSINVQRAVSMLVEVRALTPTEEITPMGRLLSKLPTDVHLGKFLLISTLFRCLDPALTIAAALNSKSPFVSPLGLEQEADRAKCSFRVENSDFLAIHNAFSSWRRASTNLASVRKFCRVNYLSHQNLQQIEELRQQFLGYLIDSNFIQVDKSFIGELNRIRYGRNRTRFVTVPPELDSNSNNAFLVHSALTAGLYPKILTIDPKNGEMRTVTNNQHALFHPSSVNFGRKPNDFGVNHLFYFTLMHSKKLYAWETGPAEDISLLLLCGECDFKLIASMASVDRKIKFRIPPKTSVALKFLREQLGNALAHQFRNKTLMQSHLQWNETGLMVLGKVKPEGKS